MTEQPGNYTAPHLTVIIGNGHTINTQVVIQLGFNPEDTTKIVEELSSIRYWRRSITYPTWSGNFNLKCVIETVEHVK